VNACSAWDVVKVRQLFTCMGSPPDALRPSTMRHRWLLYVAWRKGLKGGYTFVINSTIDTLHHAARSIKRRPLQLLEESSIDTVQCSNTQKGTNYRYQGKMVTSSLCAEVQMDMSKPHSTSKHYGGDWRNDFDNTNPLKERIWYWNSVCSMIRWCESRTENTSPSVGTPINCGVDHG
jgi:hypothetical protein